MISNTYPLLAARAAENTDKKNLSITKKTSERPTGKEVGSLVHRSESGG